MTLYRSYWHVEHSRHFLHVPVLQIKQSHNFLLSLGKTPKELLRFKLRHAIN